MHFGIDLGSRAVKIVGYADGLIAHKACYDTARFYREFGRMDADGLAVTFESLGLAPSGGRLAVTGYGRNALRVRDAAVISEVKAHTIGASHQVGMKDFTLLDIGGQDTKVIKISGGRMEDFVMNDKCAASSGRYIENMAAVLDMALDQLSGCVESPASLSATCAIFGESEIIQRMAEGVPARELAAGVNLTIARRVLPMLGRFPDGPIVFSGGVARNAAVASLIKALTRRDVIILPEPVFNGALGCSLS